MRPTHWKLVVACILASAFSSSAFSSTWAVADEDSFKDWHKNWNVKRGVADAQVIMVARVTHVGKIKVVEGAKTNQYFREFKFQPIKILKGVYSRDELTMSAADLGCRTAIGVDAKDIKEDQLRVLLLSQSNPFGLSYGCAGIASSANIRQSIPIIKDLNDPIVAMYQTMIKIDNLRSRKQRSQLLVDAINESKGPSLIPLMQAVKDDMVWATASKAFGQSLISSYASEDAVIREFSFGLICDACQWQTGKSDSGVMRGFSKILQQFLTGKTQHTTLHRIRAFNAAIKLEKIKRSNWLEKELEKVAIHGRTFQERGLGIRALGELKSQNSLDALAQQLKTLPLDANENDESRLLNAIHNIDADLAFELAKSRFSESLVYGIQPILELRHLAKSDNDQVDSFLLEMLDDHRAHNIRSMVIAHIGYRKIKQAVPKLGKIVRSNSFHSISAQRALIEIGTREAAVEIRPLMRTLRQLSAKLPIAKLLAKHGMNDGQSMAIEHLADGGQVSKLCAEVLYELNDDATKKQLVEIIKKNPDKKWYIGAVNGLMAMNHDVGFKAFAEIISDDRHPLLLQALQLGELAGKKSLFDHGAELIESRNDKIALTYLSQIKLVLEKEPLVLAYFDKDENKAVGVAFELKMPELERKILKSLKKIVSDSYVNSNVRKAAMELLVRYDTGEIQKTLIELADRVDLKGFQTLTMAENEILRREIELK